MDEKYSKLSPDCPIRIEKQNPKLSLSTDTELFWTIYISFSYSSIIPQQLHRSKMKMNLIFKSKTKSIVLTNSIQINN